MSWDKLIHRRAEKYVSALQANEMKSHVPLETGNPGRPLTDSTPASGHIHLRVTMERKNRYVRVARERQEAQEIAETWRKGISWTRH